MLAPDPRDYIYDIEVYPNVFTYSAKHVLTGERYRYEFSFRRDDLPALIDHLRSLSLSNARQVGFNNIGYDYIIIHFIINMFPTGRLTPYKIYEKNCEIFAADHSERFAMLIWDNDRYIEQVDLYKIHHFDNNARRTSLKILEFNMRQENIEDLPFPPGTFLESEQIDTLLEYNGFDVDSTENFYFETIPMIKFREELSEKYGKSFINYSDKKIGSEILVAELGADMCYEKIDGKRQPRQTHRAIIHLGELIFPYIYFRNPEFNRIKNWLANQSIRETKGVFKNLTCKIDDCLYVFGTGGLHGGFEQACIIKATDDMVIIDVDVKSFYPRIGIENKAFPEHLSEKFCDSYNSIYLERQKYPKKTHPALNNALKLALNGAYGDSNNPYSFLFDPQYTMLITINGQLLLCMLADQLMTIPGLRIVQANTDGITFTCHKKDIESTRMICKYWESITKLELEEARYSRIFVRDVNSYIAEYTDGKLKRKGAYIYETPLDNKGTQEVLWHKNHSSLIIAKAAEAALVHGKNIREFITNHDNFFDFMLCTKVPRSSKLVLTVDGADLPLQNITRYHISNKGGSIVKVMPPIMKKHYVYGDLFGGEKQYVTTKAEGAKLEKKMHVLLGEEQRLSGSRRIGINVDWKVNPCNNMKDADRNTLNYEFYISETEKLVNPLLEGEIL